MPQCGQQLERRLEITLEFRLGCDPGFRMRHWLEDPPTSAHGPLDQSAIDQKQQDGRSAMERLRRPIRRPHQVILQVQPGVPDGILEERKAVLVIAMQPVMTESADPVTSQFVHE
jgi:hypothetical protein